MEEIFDIEKFNLISDDENYYFFRSLEPGDIEDLEKGIIKEGEKYKRLRTDRERWEETNQEKPRWNADSIVTLEEMFNHIKMHYSLQTNCISLSSNANVARTYGETFSDKYVMIRVPKKEMGEKVFHAGQYMLQEITKQVEQRISEGEIPKSILNDIEKINDAKASEEIKELIKSKYKVPQKLDENKAHPKKGITYKSPQARISSWQSLNQEQILEKNKIIAKLTILEHKKLMKPLISNSANNSLLIQTIGSAFASSEQIYYGAIQGNRITDIPKEIVDMFGLLQQVKGQDKQIIDELKRELIHFINDGKKIEISKDSILKDETQVKDDISIEEMYELTEGKVEYGQANSIVKNLFYLAKGQLSARTLADELRKITNNNSEYEEIIKYIKENGFQIEPKISTRLSNKGYRLSESVNLNLNQNEIELVEQVKKLSDEEQEQIVQSRGLSNVQGVMTNNFSKLQNDDKISKERYYAEAIFSMYDWKKIGIEEFSTAERENLIQKIQEKDCVNLYKEFEQSGIKRSDIPTVLLNTITGKKHELKEELSIERVERFLGYYDVPNTGIQLRPYQQRATEKTDEILEKNRFASVILPTGGGKSFVALDQLMKHKDEKMLYLVPQNEILEQMKDYIIKYIHGSVNTLGKSKDEIVAQVFPNLTFVIYPSLLSKEGEELLREQYDFITLDELHRTGAKEWGDKLNTLLSNQLETTKVLGITATPRRDTDGKNMANEIAERLGYTNKDAINGEHIAMNMSLINAIRMGLVVNPKLVSCAYSLKTDGSLNRLKEKIEQIEDIQARNEKLEEYETLRRNLDGAEGISDILQSNVKKGGKYIVFLPMIEDIEDEDGNVIGRKKGKDKIVDYENKISEYFNGSDITPNFHSMLGEYGDKDNERRLEEFQCRNTDNTEFMLVMNKANEGLHLEKLDGMIWFRPMDENSKILYLQQLGRVIYAEDPNNPTINEDRPVVIDLVNNTIKVNWENEITEQDDIELMNIVIDWIKKHDGILPNVNSNDKEEIGYARVIKEIQNKYKKYLDKDFKSLSDAKIDEIQEIIQLGSEIDLWGIELQERNREKNKSHNNVSCDSNYGPFEINGILKDFVDLEKETPDNENTVEKFIGKMKKLKGLEVDVSKVQGSDTIQTLAEKSGVKITEEQAELIGVKLNDKIGSSKNRIALAYRGKGTNKPPTAEQVMKLLELGISLELSERDVCQEFISEIKKVKDLGIDVSKIQKTDTIQTLADKSGVKITEEQAEKLEIKLSDKIGHTKISIVQAYRGNGRGKPPTEEQVESLLELGVILEKKERNVCQEFINKIKKLQKLEVDVSKIQYNDTIQTLAQKSGIEITEEQAQKLEIDLDDKIGSTKNHISRAYRGKKNYKRPTLEQIAELTELGISLEKTEKDVCQEFISKMQKLNKLGINLSNIQVQDTIQTLAEKSRIQITEEQAEELEIKLDDKIGSSKSELIRAVKGKVGRRKPTKEQVNQLSKLGISLEGKKNATQEFIEKIEILNKLGIDTSKIRARSTIQTLAQKSGVQITEKQSKELGIKLDDKIGSAKSNIAQAYRGKNGFSPPTKEQVDRLLELGVNLEYKSRTSKEIAEASISAIKDIELVDKENKALQELIQKTKEGGKVNEQS